MYFVVGNNAWVFNALNRRLNFRKQYQEMSVVLLAINCLSFKVYNHLENDVTLYVNFKNFRNSVFGGYVFINTSLIQPMLFKFIFMLMASLVDWRICVWLLCFKVNKNLKCLLFLFTLPCYKLLKEGFGKNIGSNQ